MNKNIQEELRETLLDKIPCIDSYCDKHGTTMDGSSEEPEPAQCQFCYQERFPAVDQALEAINSLVRECIGEHEPFDFQNGNAIPMMTEEAYKNGRNKLRQQFLNRWLCLEDGLTIKQRMEKLENNLMERKSE